MMPRSFVPAFARTWAVLPFLCFASAAALVAGAAGCRREGAVEKERRPDSATIEQRTGELTVLARTGWTATASLTNGTNVAQNAVDTTATSRWNSGANQVSGQWFKVNFGTARVFTAISMDTTATATDYPRTFKVEVSNDDSTWTTALASATGSSAVVTAAFASQTARYVRVTLTGGATNNWSIYEFNVYGTALSRAGWTAMASSTASGTTIAGAFDGSSSSRWSSTSATSHQFQVDMQAPQTFNQVTLDAGSSTSANFVRSYTVSVSNDGAAFTSVVTGTGTSRFVVINFAFQSARHIRIAATNASAWTWSIEEMEVNGQPTLAAAHQRSAWTPSGTTAASGTTLAGAVDGSTTTRWTANTVASGTFYQVDMAALRTFNQITIDAGTMTANFPRSYKVEISSNASAWTQIAAGTNAAALLTVNVQPQTARHIKVSLTAANPSGSPWSIQELNVSGPALSRTAWTASASPTSTTNVPGNALDGSATTRWDSGVAQANNQTFTIDMGAPQVVNQLTLDAGTSTGNYPRGYSVSVSTDGSSWGTPVATGTGGTQLVTINFLTTTARFIRVTQTGSATNSWSIYEANVWRVAQPCDGTTCTAPDACHSVGACDVNAGACPAPVNANENGTCNDNNACTTGEKCHSGACNGGTATTCTASDQCHDVGTCNTSTGVCSNPAKTNGTNCNDNNACTQTSTCQTGVCTGANPVVCTASDQCHDVGTCNTSTGVCSNPAKTNGTNCNDNNACTQTDTCQGGACTGTGNLAVDDHNPCTTDSCNAGAGPIHTPVAEWTPCSDGNACNGLESCRAGVCTPEEAGAATTCASTGSITFYQSFDSGTTTVDVSTGGQTTPNKDDVTAPLLSVPGLFGPGIASETAAWIGYQSATNNGTPSAGFSKPGSASVWVKLLPGHSGGVFLMGLDANAYLGVGEGLSDDPACLWATLGSVAGVHTDPRSVIVPTPATWQPDGEWHLVVVNWSLYGLQLVVDGVGSPVSQPATQPAPAHYASDGGWVVAGGSGTGMLHDEVLYLNRPLTMDEIAWYYAQRHHDPAVTANPARQRFSGGAGCNMADDLNPCTADACDPVAGVTHTPLTGVACNDGNACTTGTMCQAGVCGGGTAVTCVAPNDCTSVEACVPSTGCPAPVAVNEGGVCDDDNANTAPGICAGGTCRGTVSEFPGSGSYGQLTILPALDGTSHMRADGINLDGDVAGTQWTATGSKVWRYTAATGAVEEIAVAPGDAVYTGWESAGIGSDRVVVGSTGWHGEGFSAPPGQPAQVITDRNGYASANGINGAGQIALNGPAYVGTAYQGYVGGARRDADGSKHPIGMMVGTPAPTSPTLGGGTFNGWSAALGIAPNSTDLVGNAGMNEPDRSFDADTFTFNIAFGMREAYRFTDPYTGPGDRHNLNDYAAANGWQLLYDATATNGTYVVGWGAKARRCHAFRYTIATNEIIDLDEMNVLSISHPGGDLCGYGAPGHFNYHFATGINAYGEIVGNVGYGGAFYYSDATGMVDLQDLVDPGLNITIGTAAAINDKHEIVGSMTVGSDPRSRAYKLKLPEEVVPPPLILSFDGLVQMPDASTVAIFGYTNDGSTNVNVRYGAGNTLTADGQPVAVPSPAPPEWFLPGPHPGAFVTPMTAQTIVWAVGGAHATATAETTPLVLRDDPAGQGVDLPGGGFLVLVPATRMGTVGGLVASDKVPNLSEPFMTPGTTHGQFAVTPRGNASYTIPLDLPPGRNGIEPHLALHYESNAGDDDSLGLGWSLQGLSRITRCPRSISRDGSVGAVDYTANDVFCLDGEVLRVIDGSSPDVYWRPERTNASVRMHLTSDSTAPPEYFEVTRKDGRIFKYAAQVGAIRSRFEASSVDEGEPSDKSNAMGPTTTYAWLLSEVRDGFGNKLSISYEAVPLEFNPDGGFRYGEKRPTKIQYTYTNAPSEARRAVEFFYDFRPDPVATFVSGVPLRNASRLRRITVTAPDNSNKSVTLKTYYLDYDTLHNGGVTTGVGQTILVGLQECEGGAGRTNPATICKFPVRLEWEQGTQRTTSTATPIVADVNLKRLLVADIDGDGDDDLLTRVRVGSANKYVVHVNDGGGSFHQGPSIDGLAELPADTAGDDALLDLNGDGAMDLVVRANASAWTVYSFVDAAGAIGATAIYTDTVPAGVSRHYVGDFNGDGFTDFIRPADGGDPVGWSLFLGNGATFDPPLPPAAVALTPYPDTAYVARTRSGASASLLIAERDSLFATRMYELRFDQAGHALIDPAKGWPFFMTSLQQFDFRMKPFHDVFVDFNGDGLTDVLKIPNAGGDCSLIRNSGNGFATTTPCGSALSFGATNGDDPGVRIGDFDDDGRPDVIFLGGQNGEASPKKIRFLSGSGGFNMTHANNPTTMQDALLTVGATPGGGGFRFSQLGDFNADGRVDFVQAEADGFLHVYIRSGKKAGLLTGIFEADGQVGAIAKTVSIDYQALATGKEPLHGNPVYAASSTCRSAGRCVVRGPWVVGGYALDDGIGGQRQFGLAYSDGRSDPAGRGFLGFTTRTFEDRDRQTVSITFSDNMTVATAPISGAPAQVMFRAYPYVDLPKIVTTTTTIGARTRLVLGTTTFDAVTGPINPTKFFMVEPRQILHTVVDSSPTTLIQNVATTLDWDAFDNLIDKTVKTNTSGTDPNAGTTLHYHVDFPPATAENAAARIFAETYGLPAKVTLTSTDDTGKTATRTTSYDYYPDTTLLKRRTIEPDGPAALRLVEDYSPYDLGRPTTVTQTGPIGETRSTTLEYDGQLDDVFPVAAVNGLHQRTKITYVTALGKVGRVEDPNAIGTSFQYDIFGRVRGRAYDNTQRAETIHYDIPRPSVMLVGSNGTTMISTESTGGGKAWIVTDALGREIARQHTNAGTGLARQDVTYDALGRVAKAAVPSFGATSTKTSFVYDNLDRMLERHLPDGNVETTTYDGLTATSVNASGVRQVATTDVGGRVVSTAEDRPTGGLVESTYHYGPFGRLETITPTQDPNHPLSMDYDDWSRVKNVRGPDAAQIDFTYTPWGEVENKIQSGITTTRLYDAVGRVRYVASTGEHPEQTKIEYDGAKNGIGRLWRTTNLIDGVVVAQAYDIAGRPSEATWTIGDESFVLERVYDPFGRVGAIRYPATSDGSRFVVRYDFDVNGAPSAAHDAAAPPTDFLWSAAVRSASGQIEQEIFGNLAFSHSVYDDFGRLRHVDTTLPNPLETVQNLDFTYRPDGNLSTRTDNLLKTAEQFDYDSMNRLSLWSGGPTSGSPTSASPWRYRYLYDDLGNLKSRTALIQNPAQPDVTYTYAEAGAGVHALTSSTLGAAFAYDVRGNQQDAVGRHVTFNSRNLPRTITTAAGETAFTYDGSGSRVLTRAPDGDVVTLGDLYERRSNPGGGTLHLFRVPGAGRLVAVVRWVDRSGTIEHLPTQFLHRDYLGSVESVSDQNRFVEHLRYDPFGKRLDANALPNAGPTSPLDQRFGFTGQMHDDAFGLVNMRGRMMDPENGRFLSLDPVIGTATSSGQNRYAYALNNPMRYVDPTGFDTEVNGCEGPAADPNCDHINDPSFWNPADGDRTLQDRQMRDNWADYLNGRNGEPGAFDPARASAEAAGRAATCDSQSCGQSSDRGASAGSKGDAGAKKGDAGIAMIPDAVGTLVITPLAEWAENTPVMLTPRITFGPEGFKVLPSFELNVEELKLNGLVSRWVQGGNGSPQGAMFTGVPKLQGMQLLKGIDEGLTVALTGLTWFDAAEASLDGNPLLEAELWLEGAFGYAASKIGGPIGGAAAFALLSFKMEMAMIKQRTAEGRGYHPIPLSGGGGEWEQGDD